MSSVYEVLSVKSDEALACYLLRVATNETVQGIRALLAPIEVKTSNAELNRNLAKIAKFVRQPLAALEHARVCLNPTQSVLREKFVRMATHAFCPICIKEKGYFRCVLRHGLVSACVEHRCQLEDTCPSCEKRVELTRSNLFHCPCGQELAAIAPRPAKSAFIWVAAGIEALMHSEEGWPNLGNTQSEHWQAMDELILLAGSYRAPDGIKLLSTHHVTKFHTVAQAQAFLSLACQGFNDFPTSFENEVKQRLQMGDKSKAGLSS